MTYYQLTCQNNRHKQKTEQIKDAIERLEKRTLFHTLLYKQNDKKQKIISKCKQGVKAGICSEERSMISPDYARNFICDFIIGKKQENQSEPELF